MKKPSDRIQELYADLFEKVKVETSYHSLPKTEQAVVRSNVWTRAVINFLDEAVNGDGIQN